MVRCARFCDLRTVLRGNVLVGAPAWETMAHPGEELFSEISSVLVVIYQFQRKGRSCLRSGHRAPPLSS